MLAVLILFVHLVAAVNAKWPPPEPCTGYCNSHDPSVIRHTNGTYFRFSSSNKVATSESLQGPWTAQPGFVDKTIADAGGAGVRIATSINYLTADLTYFLLTVYTSRHRT